MHPVHLSRMIMLGLSLAAGCGFSQAVNSNLHEQEKNFEVEASKQMLQQTHLIVGGVMARATQVEPQATARCESIPNSMCTVCYLASETEQSLELNTPSCSIEVPAQAKDFSLQLSLRDLSLAATQSQPNLVLLRGQGHLDLSAQLPLLGTYSGTAAYQVLSGQIHPADGSFVIGLKMTYQSGESALVELLVNVAGTPQKVEGQIMGAGLNCTIGGTLKSPSVTCN